jgi:aryl-alcohol dehydrogenase-like predicted oxidoreductase
MTAGDCYRFQLSSPHVDLAVTGPRSRAELEHNLDALEKKGPLDPDEEKWMRAYGRAVHG